MTETTRVSEETVGDSETNSETDRHTCSNSDTFTRDIASRDPSSSSGRGSVSGKHGKAKVKFRTKTNSLSSTRRQSQEFKPTRTSSSSVSEAWTDWSTLAGSVPSLPRDSI